MVTAIQSIKFTNGIGHATYRGREIRCVQPLTGSYECALMMVSRGASVFYQAFPVMMENKDIQFNKLIVNERARAPKPRENPIVREDAKITTVATGTMEAPPEDVIRAQLLKGFETNQYEKDGQREFSLLASSKPVKQPMACGQCVSKFGARYETWSHTGPNFVKSVKCDGIMGAGTQTQTDVTCSVTGNTKTILVED